jgi:signal transduction histidine kinase
VIRLWTKDQEVTEPGDLKDLTRFNEAIDECLAESLVRFSASLEQSRNMFAAILGHDLRNPLGAIIMGASYLRDILPAGSDSEVMALRILSSGDRMRRLITDILDFSRIQLGGEIQVVPAEMNMEAVCREAVDEILARHPERVVTIKTQGDLSARWDQERVAQVVSNLVSNAFQHGDSDSPVTIILVGEPEEVQLKVQNWGPLISPENLRTIFDPLKRLAAQQERNYSGSMGLGLHIARTVVAAHGGSLEVESTKETGTVFTARWPRNVPA